MQVSGWPRAAAVLPVLAVASAAALLFLVALSIALQPPATGDVGVLASAVEWARALFFSAGTVAFLVGMVAFARVKTDEAVPEPAGLIVSEVGPSAAFVSAAPAEVTAAEQARGETAGDAEPFYTLVAVGADADDPRAIADFDEPEALLTAMGEWRALFPDEELRVFGAGGSSIAVRHPRQAASVRARGLTRPSVRRRPRQAGLVLEGA